MDSISFPVTSNNSDAWLAVFQAHLKSCWTVHGATQSWSTALAGKRSGENFSVPQQQGTNLNLAPWIIKKAPLWSFLQTRISSTVSYKLPDQTVQPQRARCNAERIFEAVAMKDWETSGASKELRERWRDVLWSLHPSVEGGTQQWSRSPDDKMLLDLFSFVFVFPFNYS